MRTINWGIIGLGNIAKKFAKDIMLSHNSNLYGVASRDIEKAKKFSQDYNSSTFFGTYEDLANDPEVDVIYIATPHVFHFDNTMMCLKRDKAVLCEKPMGMNSIEVKTMVRESQLRNLFLMEGLWTRFIPAFEKFLKLIDTIGKIAYIRADFGFKANHDIISRIFNKQLGAGSLLDIGIYPVFLSLITLGIPIDMKVMARMTTTEVDSFCSILFDYKNGSKAILESTIEADTPTEAYIFGTKGDIKLHSNFHHAEKITVKKDNEIVVYDKKYKGNGYLFEIEEVNKCIISGETQSQKLPLELSLDLSFLLDRIRKNIGLEYESDSNFFY